MGSTRLLTNIIQRKVMLPEEMSPSMQRDNFEVALTDFEKHPIIKCLFKADNQRSTECWSVQEIANFIEDCTEDQNINLCILYWKDIHGNIYIIDGAHRLSCIYAWINRYFADEQVPQAPNFNDQQKQDIRYLRNYLGDLADFQRICTDAEFAEKKSKLGDIKISFRQVLGTPEDARRVFQSINSDTKRLDKYEEYHLRNRGSDAYYAIYACCYINDNKSNLEELQYTRLNELIELGERIHQLLFSTILLDNEMSHGKKIGLVNELMNIIAGDQIHNIMSLNQGERVENLMSHLLTILCRIATPVKNAGVPSLGLHPYLYFYKDQRFQITSFLAWFSIVYEIHESRMQIHHRKISFKDFTRVRRSIEFLIANFPVATTETVGKFGSGIKGYDRLQIVYNAFICLSLEMEVDFDDEKCLNTFILSMSKAFKYINFNEFYVERFLGGYDDAVVKNVVGYVESISPISRSKPKAFSALTKSLLKHNFVVGNHNFCLICDGLIYLDSTESDHRIAKAVGGQGVLENGLLVHPICNRMKSDLSLEEIRADLFGELLY
ncbi:HNH endonuclease signature motif containing protein [Acinetobacter radioresistens]|uniref:HNH endonuclease signature motif containing protein n=1 Tax=Acinetobacter radioresistens TaxID=40216 RepID=UPI00061935A6|nr:HNH endonuclease signature motif containing protein [Acinetobacter radioresistens]